YGEKGKRFALPNAEVMIHQPLGGVSGQASDIAITAENIIKTKNKMVKMLSDVTGQKIDKISKDVDRDFWMDAEDAKKYGVIDKIMQKPKK
ncbi:MAG: ATP-dependent Clp protease proteolytic subunit, partial [Bacteroidetes bacterium]|nr:ATP-dependent Clp protease proteolytic subunit [Bacteroidota bacterium]